MTAPALPPSHRTGSDLFAEWWAEVTSTEPPPGWPSHDPASAHVEVAPGRIVLLAGPPGAGKTAYLGQWITALLGANPELRVLLANVEMTPRSLLDRELSRSSGVPLTDLRRRQVKPADRPRLDTTAKGMRGWLDRLAFASDPYRLDSILTAASDHGADIVAIDYVQRVAPAEGRKASGLREQMNTLMTDLRRVANDGGVAFLAACAVSRSRDDRGRSSYAGQHLSLASLRESGELEFGADDVLLLAPSDDADRNAPKRSMLLAHAKSRHGEPRDMALSFDRRIQRFEPDEWLAAAQATTESPSTCVGRRGVSASPWKGEPA